MNNLTFNLLVDRIIKRNVAIFSILARHTDPIDLDFLIYHSKYSKRTILTFVASFNSENPYDMEIIQQSTNTLILKIDNPSAISLYLNSITKDNILFDIIDCIYFDNFETIESISEKLYISESTLKRYLTHLKKVLKKYNLFVQLTPYVAIIGDEATIRYFYFKYFRYVHDKSTLPIRVDLAQAIFETISSISRDMGFALNVDHPRATYWTAIVEHRVRNGHHIILNDSLLETHQHSASFSKFKKYFQLNFKNNSILSSLSHSELVYAFIIRLDTLSYESNTAFYMNDYIFDLVQFEPIIATFFNARKLHPGLNHELKMSLQAFLLNITFLTELSPFFQKLDEDLFNQSQHNYPDIFNEWLQLLKEYHLDFKFSKYVAISLTLITVSYLKFSHPKNILFSFSGDASTINYFKSIALKFVPSDAIVTFIFNQSLTDELLQSLNIDVCILNFIPHSPITVCPTIQLSTIPLEMEWEALSDYL